MTKCFHPPYQPPPTRSGNRSRRWMPLLWSSATVLACCLRRVAVPLPNGLCVQDDEYGNFPNFILGQIKTFLLDCFIITIGSPTGFVVGFVRYCRMLTWTQGIWRSSVPHHVMRTALPSSADWKYRFQALLWHLVQLACITEPTLRTRPTAVNHVDACIQPSRAGKGNAGDFQTWASAPSHLKDVSAH